MNCKKCGCELPSDATVCPGCETVISRSQLTSEDVTYSEPYSPPRDSQTQAVPNFEGSQDISQNLKFSMHKSLATLTYKEINTSVHFTDCQMEIESRRTWFAFIKGSVKKKTIPLEDIKIVTTRRTWDISDMFFATIFACGAVRHNWLCLLMTLVFVWSAAGYCIEIQLKDNSKIKIPYSSLRENPSFVSILTDKVNNLHKTTNM